MLERRKSQYKLTERRGAGAGVRRTPTRWSRVSPTSDEHNEPVYCAVGFSDGHRIQVCSWNKFQPVRCYKTSKSFESCSKLEILIDIQELFDVNFQVQIYGNWNTRKIFFKIRLDEKSLLLEKFSRIFAAKVGYIQERTPLSIL